MKAVDAVIERRLGSDIALINSIGRYIVGAGGKRVRPMLVLLFARALGQQGPQAHELAAIVEFIHTATLLHDDVVDESSMRRGRATANARFGNPASVLVGDFVYSRAFQMMVGLGRLDILEILADATNVIAEGEVLQLMNMHNPDITVEAYLRVIRFKTAKLFEASARLGAMLANAEAGVQASCAGYGRAVGTAFQLVDDMLDYTGATEAMGKNIGDDLREGKPTLPMLLAMERGSAEQRGTLRHAIENGAVDRLEVVVDIVRSTGALEATLAAAKSEVEQARNAVQSLPASPYKDGLIDFASASLGRSS
ncbi:MAG TPA: polyprenyl synthetase family protein [Methylibium sp.]|uniref:polyprenyl synthetase family protein n=1 Tax=Methylibium sp. TaxID=2067992 RepID=UPI002DB5D7BD|nr:polyprenyl synthetase family protein [Methylibium sp.]HEU4458365.1 polyprenyl synthetase family protein [Methylibium sp.]